MGACVCENPPQHADRDSRDDSGASICQSEEGKVEIGASDPYLPHLHPATMMNIPLAISTQQMNDTLPGINGRHLRLSQPVLAGIYTGKIRMWNAPQIQALNPRSEPPDARDQVRAIPGWPKLALGIAAAGNSGMMTTVKDNSYSVTYIGGSHERETMADHPGQAMLKNRTGRFRLPNVATIESAAVARVGKIPKNETLSLVFAPGPNGYPIINYEHAIVSKTFSPAAGAVRTQTFLTWALTQRHAPWAGAFPAPRLSCRTHEQSSNCRDSMSA